MTAKRKPETAHSSSAPNLDLAQIERLLEFMNLHGLEEFEYAHGDVHVRLKKPAAGGRVAYAPVTAPEIVVAAPHEPAIVAAAPPAEGTAEAGRSEDLHIVKSPIVGTFYEAPSPGAEPFVEVGDQIAVAQVLCIIEAMKLMNEIESDVAGEVVRIYVENGQPVEYGESLFAIRPARKK